jgi:hypothetical protein
MLVPVVETEIRNIHAAKHDRQERSKEMANCLAVADKHRCKINARLYVTYPKD